MGKSSSRVYDPAIHHRRSIRLRGHDYSSRGVYFVTICVKNRRPLFGTVVNGRMVLNDIGRNAISCWRDIPNHFPRASLDEFIVMPDHLHGIIVLRVGGHGRAMPPPLSRPRGTSRTIGSIVRGFKIGVTKSLGGDSPWQRGYYDIIVRNQRAMDNIRAYIRNNPVNYDMHRYGEPRFFTGNRALLDLPLTAFLASRRVADGVHDTRNDGAGMGDRRGEKSFAPSVVPSQWPARPNCVVSGFVSPMERAVFDACLDDGIPMVQILARGMPDGFPSRIRHAMAADNLLVMTPFDPDIDRLSGARAAWCNQYVLHVADTVVIGRLNSDGMLACLLSDLPCDKTVAVL